MTYDCFSQILILSGEENLNLAFDLFIFVICLIDKFITLSVEKIPVVLIPVIKLPVKSMASIGTQEKTPNFRDFIDFGELFVEKIVRS